MGIPRSARDKERILNSADIHLARMVGVPRGAEMFVDGSFVVNLIFCNEIVGVNLQCGIFIRAGISGQCTLYLAPFEYHSRQVTTAPYRAC